MIKKVDFEDAKKYMDDSEEYVIVDVREEEEYITGHATDALLFPVDEITKEKAEELLPDKNIPIFIYCRSGRRSKEAAIKLDQYGYEEIYDIGSLIGWPYGIE